MQADQLALAQLRAIVKEKFSHLKGLIDASRDELERALKEGANNPSLLTSLQEQWRLRSQQRHQVWMNGESKSAKAARQRVAKQSR